MVIASNNTIQRQGYKLTEVGMIPEDWEVKSINNFITEFRGGAPLAPKDFTEYGIRVLPKGGVVRGGKLKIREDEQQYCSKEYAEAHTSNQVDQSYIVVVLRDLVPSGPNIGLMVKIEDTSYFVLAQGVYGFKLNQDQAEAEYLIQASNGSGYRKLMHSIMVGSTQVHITNTAFRKILFPIPPLPEQQAIATVLSDVDTLITSLNKLIAKKRDIKQATMQQLLTGKVRLAGFEEEWKLKKLGEFLRVCHGKSQHHIVVQDGQYPILATSGEIGRTNIYLYNKPSVLIGRKGTIDSPQYMETPFWTIDTLFYTAISERNYPKFIFYLFHTIDWLSYNEASGVPSLNAATIENIEVHCPPLLEQQAIATILSDMDAEILALEQKRDKTRKLKQGMMQELLTGKTRLL